MFLFISIVAAAMCLTAISLFLLSPALKTVSRPGDLQIHWFWRLIWPWFDFLASSLKPFLSWKYRLKVKKEIIWSGREDSLEPFHVAAMQCIAGSGTALAGYLYFCQWLRLSPVVSLALVLLLAALGSWLPRHYLRKSWLQRKLKILKQFPFFLDMLTLCLEAGLSFHAALVKTTDLLSDGPLKKELRYTLSDMRTGTSRAQALEKLTMRVNLTEINYFASSVQQSSRMGSELGPILKSQAEQRRKERFLRAEKQALEAPVKMLFPLVSCFFPCTFIVLMFPIGVKLLDYVK